MPLRETQPDIGHSSVHHEQMTPKVKQLQHGKVTWTLQDESGETKMADQDVKIAGRHLQMADETTNGRARLCRQVSQPSEIDSDIELHTLKPLPKLLNQRCNSSPLLSVSPQGVNTQPIPSLTLSPHTSLTRSFPPHPTPTHDLHWLKDSPHCVDQDTTGDSCACASSTGCRGDGCGGDGNAIPGVDSVEGNQREKEGAKIRIQKRVTELILKHIPDMMEEVSALETSGDDSQLCHDIVKELKMVGDALDKTHQDKSPLQAMQETLHLNLRDLVLPSWVRQGVGPALAKTVLNAALQYQRM